MSRFFTWLGVDGVSFADAVLKPIVAIVVIGLIAATQLAAFMGVIIALKYMFSS